MKPSERSRPFVRALGAGAESLRSLRFRLILLVLLAVVPAFLLILRTAEQHRALIGAEVQMNALRAARAIAANQERFLEGAHQFLLTLSRLPQIRSRDRSACAKILAGLLEPTYSRIAVVEAKGGVICQAPAGGPPHAMAPAGYVERALERSGLAIGDFRVDAETGKATVDLAYPVSGGAAAAAMAVSVSLDLGWVMQVAAAGQLFPGATASLIDDGGSVLVSYPHRGAPGGARLPDSGRLAQVLSRRAEGALELSGGAGVGRLIGFSPLKIAGSSGPIHAAVELPAELAFAEGRRLLRQNLASLGVVAALAILCAWVGAETVALRRIRDLLQATRRVAAGDLGTRSSLPYGGGELGELARAFDELAGVLEAREAERRAAAAELERQRDRERTLYEIASAMTSTLDLKEVLEVLLQKIESLLVYSAATVRLVNPQSGELEPIACRNVQEEEWRKIRIADGLGLPGVVVRTQAPLVVENAQSDPRTLSPEFFRRHGLISYLGLPMMARGKTVGVLSFYTREKRSFTDEEIHFLGVLDTVGGFAIAISLLFEEIKRQAAELERSNAAKDEFLGVMSHELRTPLNIIMNYAEATKMGTFGPVEPAQAKALEKIKAQAIHLLLLINGILEITKIESGKVTVQHDPVDLVAFLEELRSDYMMPLAKGVELRWECPSDLPVIASDPLKLKQILNNLLHNAIKFTERGHITVSARFREAEGTVEFRVRDTGIGIPRESIPAIFEKFHQLDSSASRAYAGAGLGLFLVKTFVDLLGGTIEVESAPGEGSVFTVKLPARPAAAPGPAEARDVGGEAWRSSGG
jgi:signal transduction histidine kinase/HAMP domain-containing protein